jgi:murein DD-endopeptidase MepM/ murein hydrolase activator NlpD
MSVKIILKTRLDGLLRNGKITTRSSTVAAIAIAVATISWGIAEAAAHADAINRSLISEAVVTPGPSPAPVEMRERLVWEGADLDGDGQPDLANPTGQAPRQTDAYGDGRFHASRDGGAREHEGVDYVATPGQVVEAPISGYVARIGYAYPDDTHLRYVVIENPALHLTARLFYVAPEVAVGDTVAVGHPIGLAQSLQRRYRGITNHVHLEVANGKGRKLDAADLIVARMETDRLAAD